MNCTHTHTYRSYTKSVLECCTGICHGVWTIIQEYIWPLLIFIPIDIQPIP